MNDLSVIEAEFGDLRPWQQCPDFWTATPADGMRVLRTLGETALKTVGQSAGGRDIVAVENGEKEALDATTDNLQTSIAYRVFPIDPTDIYPPHFYGSKRRKKPVLAIQGALHGGELTGTAASINLCHVIETGRDLRGKEWPRLQELARASRIVQIPWLNIDGAERWPIPNTSGIPADLYARCTNGVAKDGTHYEHPAMKAVFPIPPEDTAFMGSYFNDAGVNLQYDLWTIERQPETRAWMRYYLDEKPDGVLLWHCNAGSMIGPPEYYLPEGMQHEISRLAGAVRGRLLREDYPAGRLMHSALPGFGKPFMTQMDAVYHVCGATPILCELPTGSHGCYLTPDQMLDMGLLTIEEVLFYAHTDGLRAYENWEKVKRSFKD